MHSTIHCNLIKKKKENQTFFEGIQGIYFFKVADSDEGAA